MKLLLDPQVYNLQVYGGISRYYTEVFSALETKKKVTIIIPLVDTKNVYFNQSILKKNRKTYIIVILAILKSLKISVRKRTKKINESAVIKAFNRSEFDVFIPTYYNPYFIDYIGNKPFVLTVYDMIHEIFPEYFVNDSLNVVKNKVLLMEKATKIIAVSNNTKNDIIKIYPHINASKIEVVYHGNSIKVNENIDVDLPKKYILFVGSRDTYKNFIFFIYAIQDLLYNDISLNVICAGGGNFKEEELQLLEELRISGQVIQKSFREEELGVFYRKAKCFVFPSSYEGFGIPVLESMACGCPIILGNHSSFPEVAGNAGIYYELENSIDLKNKVKSVLNNESLRNKYIEKGLEQAKKFNWETAADQCHKVYSKALQGV